ncbi:MAG: hypothetical protein FD123_1496 [Bacteroidetes bacterium]|nr:MAG: hypothetical protein FD123_1496 [Bacteroidota bacterium]
MAKRKISALLFSFLFPLLCLLLVVFLTDRPLSLLPKTALKNKRAVLAVRDDVTPLQKTGSRLFTLGLLDETYSHTCYITENDDDHRAFEDSLHRLLIQYDTVDIFLLAHGNYYYEYASRIDSVLRQKIGLVYNTGCGNAWQWTEWIARGADTYIGHTGGQSSSPYFYFFFLRRWCAGENVLESTMHANMLMRKKLVLFAGETGNEISNESEALIYGNRSIKLAADE